MKKMKITMVTCTMIIILLSMYNRLSAQSGLNTAADSGKDSILNKNTEFVPQGMNSGTTLFADPNSLSLSGFYQNNSNNNPYLPGTHHGLLLNIAGYWNDNYGVQYYVDYTTPLGTVTPHLWYRFSNEAGYTGWYKIWCNGDDGAGSGLDADLIRGQAPQWTTSGSTIYTTNSGNVGIGTTSPQSRLAVNGTVTATQVKVTQTGWPDYVFDIAYPLPQLSETEAFIWENHHLPGIPSAGDIDNSGLDLGDMQKRQMQKIEELTLYLIRAEENMNELRNRNGQLQDKLKTFEQKQIDLEKELKQLKNK